MQIQEQIINKIINADKNTYIIFYTKECLFSQKALQLLRNKNKSFKGYNINSIPGNMRTLLDVLNSNINLINFNPNHKTKPIIFLNGNFLGGFNDLQLYFNKIEKN